jgi:hypothetical protein
MNNSVATHLAGLPNDVTLSALQDTTCIRKNADSNAATYPVIRFLHVFGNAAKKSNLKRQQTFVPNLGLSWLGPGPVSHRKQGKTQGDYVYRFHTRV